ncbi:MAG TPA: carbon-nitrogen hydrolase, partial [Gammaproteobacteria bacterium]|nr:carbon-nitrogen hydrolase [Gammaproteobacteria bacterium]
MTNSLRVALVQHACGDDLAANMERSLAGIREAAERGAKLIMLQELHRTRYFPQHESPDLFDLAETIPGPSTEALAQAARDTGSVIVGSLFEKRAPGLYHNTAVVLDADGSLAGTYRKMHIPDDPGFYEKFYFTPGDLGFQPIQTSVGKLGVLICWDQWFPEAARLMGLAGADLLLYPTAIGWDSRDTAEEQARQRDAWITIQRSHAIANGLPVLAGNRIGHEPDPTGSSPGIDFWGSSFVAGPQGEVLALASTDQEQVLIADIDRARTENVR